MPKPVSKSCINEDIYAGFQSLRNDQRLMASKLSELESELNEHRIVIDTLRNVDPKCKCYQLIGGILCERSVQDVVPCLITNEQQLVKVISNLNEQLTKKGTEINDYKQKYNISLKGEDGYLQKNKPKEENKNVIATKNLTSLDSIF